jgi:hypothetical protein
VIAEMLSPCVCQLHSLDETIDELALLVHDPADVFARFLSLGQGDSVVIAPDSQETFFSICRELGNTELLRHFDEPVTLGNAIDHLRLHSRDVVFVASHFAELSDEIRSLDVGLISEILAQPSLVVPDEDWLFDFLLPLGHFELFDHVEFACVSSAKVNEFIDFVLFNFVDANTFLLRCLLSRIMALRCDPTFRWDTGHGLIASWKWQGRNIAKVTASPAAFGTDANCIAGSGNSRYFHLVSVPDAFVSLDFNQMRIRVRHYAIQSAHHRRSANHLRS